DVDRRDLPGLDPERRLDVLTLGARPDDEKIRLVRVARVADLTGDHLHPLVAAEEPAAHALDPSKCLHAVADMNTHLGLVVHERDGSLAVSAIQLLEEVFHRLDSTHGLSVPSGADDRPGADNPRRRVAALLTPPAH